MDSRAARMLVVAAPALAQGPVLGAFRTVEVAPIVPHNMLSGLGLRKERLPEERAARTKAPREGKSYGPGDWVEPSRLSAR
jgi:hypothetical protein